MAETLKLKKRTKCDRKSLKEVKTVSATFEGFLIRTVNNSVLKFFVNRLREFYFQGIKRVMIAKRHDKINDF